MLCAALFDAAALPFAISTAVGFALGVFHCYHRSVGRALIDLDAHPAVLRLHLARHFPFQRYPERPLSWFARKNFQGKWQEESRLVVAWSSGQDNLDVSPSVSF